MVDVYENYVKISFCLFGDWVKKWFMYNELIVFVEGGYLYDFYYLNKVDFKEVVQVGFYIMLLSV